VEGTYKGTMEGERSPTGQFLGWFIGAAILAPVAVAAGVGLMMGFSEIPVPHGAKPIANIAGKLLGCAILAGTMLGAGLSLKEAQSPQAVAGAQLGALLGLGLLAYLYFSNAD